MSIFLILDVDSGVPNIFFSHIGLLAGFPAYTATDVTIPDAGTCLAHSGGRTEARVAGDRVSRGSGKR